MLSVHPSLPWRRRSDGTFGAVIRATPEPQSWVLLLAALCLMSMAIRQKSVRRQMLLASLLTR